MLDLKFFERQTNITAKVICDSISKQGIRLTTFEIEYPRFILAELNTHRQLSKNSSSSRAIPINKMLSTIENNIAIPVYWGKAKSGMQADEEVSKIDEVKSVLAWERSFNYSKERVKDMNDIGLHKQVPNRLIEPFQMMKTVITGTDFDNFFNLRLHPDSQPEICMLAYKMYKAIEESDPYELKVGEWHLPYVDKLLDNDGCLLSYGMLVNDSVYGVMHKPLKLDDAIKISASCCAQVSYRNTDMSLEKADKIFNMLIKSDVLHASCFEHLATPVQDQRNNINGWEEGITHMNKQGQLCSGNLRGYVQYRHLLPNNTVWKFDFNERMKLFN